MLPISVYNSACACVDLLVCLYIRYDCVYECLCVRVCTHSKEGGGEGWGGVYVALSGLSPAVVHCSGLPAWRLAQLGLADSMPPQ